jgi:hypothetical protein
MIKNQNKKNQPKQSAPVEEPQF